MPTTTRLLTDETGQALVTAINNIVAAVKPNATEIQMGANDTTTVAEAIDTQNQALSNMNTRVRTTTTVYNTFADAFNNASIDNALTFVRVKDRASDGPDSYGYNVFQNGSGNYGWQIAVNDHELIYYRQKSGGTFQPWEKIALKSETVPNVTHYSQYTFPKSASEVSDGNDTYTVQNNGTAIIEVRFSNMTYSQIGFLVNEVWIGDGMITSGDHVLSGVPITFSFPVFAGDVIKAAFYSTYTVESAKLRIYF